MDEDGIDHAGFACHGRTATFMLSVVGNRSDVISLAAEQDLALVVVFE